MAMFKRIGIFLLINALVMITISFLVNFFGLAPRLSATGYDLRSLMIFCLVWGMGGAFISLMLSKVMAKWSMGVKILNPQTQVQSEREIVDLVHRFARAAGLSKMPEVGVYPSPEVNAFATGPSKSNSLVAVSSGLLETMDRRSVEGVIAHEVAHIANGDMVTMTLIQGIMNAFVMALARIVAFAISNALRSNDDREGAGLSPIVQFVVIMVLETVFYALGSVVTMWFSRQREFRADAGGAKYAGRDSMVAALQSLQSMEKRNYEVSGAEPQPAFASLKISASKPGLAHLFRTHPTLEERIKRLQMARAM